MYYWCVIPPHSYSKYYASGMTFKEACDNLGFDYRNCVGYFVK